MIGAALPTGIAMAHADEVSYSKCIDMSLQHLGIGTPASMGSWVTLGRSIDRNVHRDGASPQSQVTMVQGNGWPQPVAEAIVQCAMVNSPI